MASRGLHVAGAFEHDVGDEVERGSPFVCEFIAPRRTADVTHGCDDGADDHGIVLGLRSVALVVGAELQQPGSDDFGRAQMLDDHDQLIKQLLLLGGHVGGEHASQLRMAGEKDVVEGGSEIGAGRCGRGGHLPKAGFQPRDRGVIDRDTPQARIGESGQGMTRDRHGRFESRQEGGWRAGAAPPEGTRISPSKTLVQSHDP